MIRLRFVSGDGLSSELIRLDEGTVAPITPSHVECVSQDGKFYIGALLKGGVAARPVGYDKGSFKAEFFLDIEATPEQTALFYAFVNSQIDKPYDWLAIVGFLPGLDLHQHGHLICSAFISLSLRKCSWFANDLAVPYHHIDPRDLLLVLSGRVKVSK